MKALPWIAFAAISLTGCDDVLRLVGASPNRPGGGVQLQSPIALQPAPHLEALPFDTVSCRIDATGFLGLGANRRITAQIANRGNQPGIFTIKLVGVYPGGGEVEHATTAATIAAGATETTSVEITPQPGMRSVRCLVIPPQVLVP